ncbi:hypothetical protein F0562_013007 [Nyssa sinensis]|uniref:ZZ-type domain-containing protein n=1 Tax=Nyssa sinensis TaxID=561372 RepID=A0A5J4ZYV3_9ASTE|nr:hypothetical protein F0562_013007 [Nyssa sinensis]
MIEKELEANIQGVALSEIKIQQAECPLDERAYCNNCKTFIVDFHRSCPHCRYDLCLICCRYYVDNGLGYLHVQNRDSASSKRRGTLDIPIGTSFVDHVKSTSEWKVEENGNIPCPPDSMGGCGH